CPLKLHRSLCPPLCPNWSGYLAPAGRPTRACRPRSPHRLPRAHTARSPGARAAARGVSLWTLPPTATRRSRTVAEAAPLVVLPPAAPCSAPDRPTRASAFLPISLPRPLDPY